MLSLLVLVCCIRYWSLLFFRALFRALLALLRSYCNSGVQDPITCGTPPKDVLLVLRSNLWPIKTKSVIQPNSRALGRSRIWLVSSPFPPSDTVPHWIIPRHPADQRPWPDDDGSPRASVSHHMAGARGRQPRISRIPCAQDHLTQPRSPPCPPTQPASAQCRSSLPQAARTPPIQSNSRALRRRVPALGLLVALMAWANGASPAGAISASTRARARFLHKVSPCPPLASYNSLSDTSTCSRSPGRPCCVCILPVGVGRHVRAPQRHHAPC
jgi:hypothetical protein